MNEQIKLFLQLKGFELKTHEGDFSIFVRFEKFTIIEIVFFSQFEFIVKLKSRVLDSDLTFSKRVFTKQSESINRQIECSDITNTINRCTIEFEESILMHVENLKEIKSIL